jgi:cytochrome c-type biogenesis protein CcmF
MSVGRPFFDRMSVPLAFGLLLAMGIGPFTPYRRASATVVWSRLRASLVIAAAATAALVLTGVRSPAVVTVVFIAVWMAGASLTQLLRTAPDRRPAELLRVLRLKRGYWGGQLAHLGVALVAVVIAVSGAQATRATVTLERGATADFGDYTLTFDTSEVHTLPDRSTTDAHIVFRRDNEVVWVAEPALNAYPGQRQSVGMPSVWSTLTNDLYVALAQFDTQRLTLNLSRFPLMSWLWVGGMLVVAGGFWALGGPRRKPGRTGREPIEQLSAGG